MYGLASWVNEDWKELIYASPRLTTVFPREYFLFSGFCLTKPCFLRTVSMRLTVDRFIPNRRASSTVPISLLSGRNADSSPTPFASDPWVGLAWALCCILCTYSSYSDPTLFCTLSGLFCQARKNSWSKRMVLSQY